MSRLRLCTTLIGCALCVLTPSRSEAQASSAGSSFLVNRFDTGGQTSGRYTDIGYDPVNHAYLVVWGLGSVYGRFVTADGTPLGGGPFKVSSSTANTDFPRLAYNPDSGSFMVVWQDSRANDILPAIWGRVLRYQASGVPAFTTNDFPVTSAQTAYVHPKVGPGIGYSTQSHEFLVVYQKGDLIARRMADSGLPLSDEFFLTSSSNFMDGIDVGYTPATNQFFVVWGAEWSAQTGGPKNILARLVQGGTGALSGVIEVDSWVDAVVGPPSLAYNPTTTQFLVSFYRPFAGYNTTFGRLINANGTAGGSRFTVATQGTYVGQGTGFNPVTNTFFCAFSYHDGPPFDVYGAQVSASGVPDPWFKITNIDYGLDVDYTRLASATDRPEWMSSAVAHWDKVVAQRVASSTNSSTPTFAKQSPGNAAAGLSSAVTLAWSTLAGAAGYEVCVDSTSNTTCDTSWENVGATTSWTKSNLADGTYFWQVRQAGGSATAADYGTWWSFRVGTAASLFQKSTPANQAVGQTSPATLTWNAAPGASGYSVCIDAINDGGCNATWWPVAGTSYTTAALAAGTYYWQVRATTGAVPPPMADGGAWWSFTVGGSSGAVPGAFGKSAPSNGATGQSTSPTLAWSASSGATGYAVCVDTVNNGVCDATYQSAGTNTSYTLSGQAAGTYYWMVRAANGSGTTYADNGTWWSYTVAAAATSFAKLSPATQATGLGTAVTTSWTTVTNASYQVCLSTSGPSCPTDGWWPTAAVPSRPWDNLAAGTYYWQARAIVGQTVTEADGGTWWAFVVGTGSSASRFGKLAPLPGTTTTPGAAVGLSWGAVANATYEVCVDAYNNGVCDTSWQTASSTSQSASGLGGGTYYWQVRAVVSGVRTEANVGTWWSFVVPGLPAAPLSTIPPTADFDQDGKQDLVWQHPTGSVAVWLMNGTNLKEGRWLLAGTTDWKVVGTGDFNRDGRTDLVWQNPGGSVAVWLMNGTNLANGVNVFGGTTDWKVVAVKDFNNDDRPDLIWQSATGQTCVWFMDGVNLIGSAIIYGAATDWRLAAVVDLDSDGQPDLIWQSASGRVFAWFMSGTTMTQGAWVLGDATDWTVAGAGAFSGDGHPNIVWQHPSGAVSIWIMNGNVLLDGRPIYSATTDWRAMAR